MKISLGPAALLLLAAAPALAEWPLGRGALQLETTATGVYDSNLRASADGVSDYYLSFEPVLRYRRPGARFHTDASLGGRFKRYLDHPSVNSDDADARLDWGMDRGDDRTVGADFSAGYFENSEPVPEVNARVRSRTLFGNAHAEVLAARRHLFRAGGSYRRTERDIGSDQKFYSGRLGYSFVGFTDGTIVGLDYLRQRNRTAGSSFGLPELDQEADSVSAFVAHPLFTGFTGTFTGGYRWLDRGQAEAALGLPDRDGTFFALAFEGGFLPRQYFPKTTGTLRVAYEQAEAPGLNERSSERLVGRVDVSWAVRERTRLSVFAARSQNLGISDTTIVSASGGAEIAQQIGEFLRASLLARYTDADFVNLGRTDHRWEAEASGSYQINRAWSSRFTYRFLRSDSDVAVANFDRHTAALSLRYAF